VDTAALTAENQLLREQNAVLDEKFIASPRKVELLVEKLDALSLELARLKRQVAGPKSERRTVEDPAQGHLFAADAEEAPAEVPAPAPKPAPAITPHGRRKPGSEPDEVIAATRPDTCVTCGGSLREISVYSSTRQDWRRGHFVKMRVDRPSCACDRCRTVETAPEPAMFALPRSIAGNGLVARVIVDKFADNIPLNRQVDRFRRKGLEISLSTLCEIVMHAAGLLGRIVGAMRSEQLAGGWLQADDTGLPVLDGTRGQTACGSTPTPSTWSTTSHRRSTGPGLPPTSTDSAAFCSPTVEVSSTRPSVAGTSRARAAGHTPAATSSTPRRAARPSPATRSRGSASSSTSSAP
jgi:transposase